ncbi:MAG: hypothetical protein WB383_06805 [Acidimicrobiales bacterium]
MSLRDETEQLLIEAHQASPAGRRFSPGAVLTCYRALTPTELTEVVQHLLFIVATLETIVKRYADEIEQLRPSAGKQDN